MRHLSKTLGNEKYEMALVTDVAEMILQRYELDVSFCGYIELNDCMLETKLYIINIFILYLQIRFIKLKITLSYGKIMAC